MWKTCVLFLPPEQSTKNDIQCKDYREIKTNAPSVARIFMSKRDAILQKNDSSSSIQSSPNDINDTYSAGMEEGWCVNYTSSSVIK